ncbi:MAG: helix-turn-helix transcriptional regulator [Weeksellaceae bacterium]|nr:helix-turn-helix transcriptional regulator [Weeksellaceae bacterium]
MLRLQEVMEEKGITARELALRSNISQVAISNIITGKSSPKVETIYKFAEVLMVPIADLFIDQSEKIQLIIRNELHVFYSVQALQDFLDKRA